VHVRVGCPPIVAPCFLRHRHVHGARAIRAALHEGPRLTEDEQAAMAADIGADSLVYLPWKRWPAVSA